jgi:hypothetical protein
VSENHEATFLASEGVLQGEASFTTVPAEQANGAFVFELLQVEEDDCCQGLFCLQELWACMGGV